MPLLRFDGKLNASVWDGQNNQIIWGRFHATAAGSAIPLNPNRTWAMRGNVDDGGKVLTGTGAAYLFSTRRLLLTAIQTGNNSFYGGCDRLSVNADESAVTGHVAGHWGFLQLLSGGKINHGAAVRGQVDLPSGAYSMGVVSAFMAATNDLSGTHTGPCVVLDVSRPAGGSKTWEGLLNLDSLSGTIAVCNSGSLTAIRKIPVYEDGALVGYLPVIATIS